MDSKTAAELATVAGALFVLLGFLAALWQIRRLATTSEAQVYLSVLGTDQPIRVVEMP